MTTRGPDAQHRIVILHGKDSFLRVEWSRRLRTSLETHFGGVDEFTFDGSTATLATVLDELRSYGLMSSHKLVIVDNADAFFGSEDRRRAMERYAEDPMKEATLLLRSQNWRPGNFDKIVSKIGIILKCESPSDADAARWCVARSEKQHKISMDMDAATLLVERVGADLARLDSEIGKLAVGALASGRKKIDLFTVRELVGASREEQAWEIQDAILSGDSGRAAAKLTELLRMAVGAGGARTHLAGDSALDDFPFVRDSGFCPAAQGAGEPGPHSGNPGGLCRRHGDPGPLDR